LISGNNRSALPEVERWHPDWLLEEKDAKREPKAGCGSATEPRFPPKMYRFSYGCRLG